MSYSRSYRSYRSYRSGTYCTSPENRDHRVGIDRRVWGEAGCTHALHARSRTTIDPRIPTVPGRSTSGFRQPGRHWLAIPPHYRRRTLPRGPWLFCGTALRNRNIEIGEHSRRTQPQTQNSLTNITTSRHVICSTAHTTL